MAPNSPGRGLAGGTLLSPLVSLFDVMFPPILLTFLLFILQVNNFLVITDYQWSDSRLNPVKQFAFVTPWAAATLEYCLHTVES